MKRIKRSVEIDAPVERVYEYLTQPSNLLGIWPNMLSVSNVVSREGGAPDFDWEYKMAGIKFKGHAKTEEAQPYKLVRVKNESDIASTLCWTYQAIDGKRTRLGLDVEYSITTPIVGKVAESLIAKSNERDIDRLLTNLKDVMEGVDRGAAAASAH